MANWSREFFKLNRMSIAIVSGVAFGLAIWLMYFVGVLFYALPEGFIFDVESTLWSCAVIIFTAIIVVRISMAPDLKPGSILFGAFMLTLGILGMHYSQIINLELTDYKTLDDLPTFIELFIVIFSGSLLYYAFVCKYKQDRTHLYLLPLIVASLMLTVIAPHLIGNSSLNQITWERIFHIKTLMVDPVFLFCVTAVSVISFVSSLLNIVLDQRFDEKKQVLQHLDNQVLEFNKLDPLTNLYNRSYLDSIRERDITKGHPTAFLHIDIDHFRTINDIYGFQIGDILLIEVVIRINALLNNYMTLVRLGADEFLLIARDYSLEQSRILADHVVKSIYGTYYIENHEISVTASVGIAMYPEHGDKISDVVTYADLAVNFAKQQGYNQYCVFDYSLDIEKIKKQSQLINELNRAVEKKEFILYYQPKFGTKDHKICGVESLVRWKHPIQGVLSPGYFIDVLEGTGLIIHITEWLLEEAVSQIEKWEKMGKHCFPVGVNISALQFENDVLYDFLQKLLKKYPINPQHLMIEVTERTAMRDIELCIETLHKLRTLNIKIAIDDFGTGHSSFAHLKDLPIDELKIDREFIVTLKPNSKEEIILESIVHLATRLGLVTTAEGVETDEQIAILTALGCQQIQGYYFSKPLSVDAFNAS